MDDIRSVISDQNAFYLNQMNFIDDINMIVNSSDSVIKISLDNVKKIFDHAIYSGYILESIDNAYLLDYRKVNDLEPTRCILNIRFNPKYHTFKFINEIIVKFKEKYDNVLVISGVESSKKACKNVTLKAFFVSDNI